MPRVHHVKKARKDNPAVNKGESYYWWKFAFGAKQYSATPPRRQQLTQSEYYCAVYDIEDMVDGIKTDGIDTIEEQVTEIRDAVTELMELQQEKMDNMEGANESLASTPAYQMIEERYYACESAESSIDSIDLEIPDFDEEWKEELEPEKYTRLDYTDWKNQEEEKWVQEIVDQINDAVTELAV